MRPTTTTRALARRGRAGRRGRGRTDQRAEVLAEHTAHEHEPSAEDDRRTLAQGFRRARPGSICEGGYELISKQGTRCTHGDDVELRQRAAAPRGWRR